MLAARATESWVLKVDWKYFVACLLSRHGIRTHFVGLIGRRVDSIRLMLGCWTSVALFLLACFRSLARHLRVSGQPLCQPQLQCASQKDRHIDGKKDCDRDRDSAVRLPTLSDMSGGRSRNPMSTNRGTETRDREIVLHPMPNRKCERTHQDHDHVPIP